MYVLNRVYSKIVTFLNKLIPKDKNKIVIYGNEYILDNSKRVLEYIIEKEYNIKYKVICIVKIRNTEIEHRENNIKYISNPFQSLYHHFTSETIFYYASTIYYKGDTVKNQRIINLGHGSPLKTIGNMYDKKQYKYSNKKFTYALATSKFFKEILIESYNCEPNQILLTGLPRNDLLCNKNDYLIRLGMDDYTKVIIWMPTWRKSNKSKDRIESTKDFPILCNENIIYVNDILKKLNVLIVLKPHPAQIDLDLFNNNYSNIVIIKNEFLLDKNIDLYKLLAVTDGLITDYSSVSFDYILTDKPVGFTLDDIESYGDNREFVVDDPRKLMGGCKIYNIEDLLKYIQDIVDDKDDYIQERERVRILTNKYVDSNSTERLFDFLQL